MDSNYLTTIVKKAKIKGRGDKTAGRGGKGQTARTGGGPKPDFEGGQTKVALRFPKRGGGFKPKKSFYQIVNLERLEKDEKIVKGQKISLPGVKILSKGNLTKPLIIQAAAFSQEAQRKITQAGGSFETIRRKK